MPHRRTRDTEPMDRILHWAVQSQGQWRSIILRKEGEAAVQSLKKGKSAGVDNIPAQLVQEGREDIITALTTICNKICSSARTTDKEQRHAEDNTEQIEATSGEDHRWKTGRLQSRKEHHRADLQPTNPLWEISPAPAERLPCLHRFSEGLRQGLACSFVGNHEEV